MPDTISLAERMTFQAARDLHARLNGMAGQDVAIDASAVDFLGGLAAQTLISARRHWLAAGQGFVISSPSSAFRQCLAELGLETLLPLEGEVAC